MSNSVLGDFVEITSSKRIKMSDYVSGGVPFFRSKEIIELSNNQKISNELFISNAQYIEIKNRFGVPSYGDILLTSVGTLGVAHRIENDIDFYFKDGNLTWFKNFKKNLDSQYLLYWIKSKIGQNELDRISIGSTQRALTIASLKNLPFTPPDIATQKGIAQILSILDNNAKNLLQMNLNLEDIATSIFKSWFVDFDPVYAKSRNQLTGLPDEIDKLFPDKFEDSEVGLIPEKWNLKNLTYFLSKFSTGLNPRKNFKLGEGDNYYVTIKNLGFYSVTLDEKCDKVTEDAIRKINSRSDLQKGDILFSGIGTIGKVNYIFDTPKNWNISESVFTLRANKEVTNPSFLFFTLKNERLQNYVQANASGSVQKGIRMSSLNAYKVVNPSAELHDLFGTLTSSIFEKISTNLTQINILNQLKNTLLPKLISGELQIPDAKKYLEEAGI